MSPFAGGRAAAAGRGGAGRPSTLAWVAIRLVAALMLLGPMQDSTAEDGRQLEQHLKATFLYRFLDYTEWPPEALTGPGTPYTIGILGNEQIAATLQQYAATAGVGGRLVTIRNVRAGDPLEGLHVLYVDRSQPARSAEVSRATRRHGLLVVSDWEGALDQGAMINFVLRQGRVRFEVSLPAADRAGIRFSARMLAVATYVRAGLQ
jgi:hypothetical protein